MPELPEVEVVRAGLERHVLGATITRVDVLHPRPVRRDPRGPEGFALALTGQRIVGARRRGKYFWLPLANGDALLGHLGMSGQMLIQPPGAPDETHLRVRMVLDGGFETGASAPSSTTDAAGAGAPSSTTDAAGAGAPSSTTDPKVVEEVAKQPSRNHPTLELRFVDQRMFGGLSVSEGGADLPQEIEHIARDPLDPEFDDADFVRRVRRRTAGVKRLLLDQGLISGVGNIYADEALWRARLHGDRPGDRLTAKQVRELLDQARYVMSEALGQGGTSFDSLYVNVNGESGYFDRSLHAYGREGEPCDRCGRPIRRISFMNRSSYFCPKCQPVPRVRPD